MLSECGTALASHGIAQVSQHFEHDTKRAREFGAAAVAVAEVDCVVARETVRIQPVDFLVKSHSAIVSWCSLNRKGGFRICHNFRILWS